MPTISGPITQIILDPLQLTIMLGVLLASVIFAKPEWGLGMYLSMMLWTRTVMVGPIAHTWVILAAIVLALIHHLFRHQPLLAKNPPPQRFVPRRLLWAAQHDSWIIPWMVFWWAWILLVLSQFDAGLVEIARPFLLTVIIPVSLLLIVGRDIERVRGFAMAHVITSAIGCWFALDVYGITFDYLMSDPALSDTTLVRLGVANYHFFSHFCAVAFILATALYLDSKKLVVQLLMLALAAWCAYFLLLAGARQSMSGAAVAGILLLAWSVWRGGVRMSARGLLLAVLITVLVLYLYDRSPSLIIRDNEANLGESFNVLGDRSSYWAKGLSFFAQSPIWGWGFEQTVWSHNLFIGTLSDQGIVGMIFFAGFLFFAFRRIPYITSRTEHDPRALWRVACFCIFCFAMIHGQASGNTSSTAHLYWPIALLWWLCQDVPRATFSHLAPRQVAQQQPLVPRNSL